MFLMFPPCFSDLSQGFVPAASPFDRSRLHGCRLASFAIFRSTWWLIGLWTMRFCFASLIFFVGMCAASLVSCCLFPGVLVQITLISEADEVICRAPNCHFSGLVPHIRTLEYQLTLGLAMGSGVGLLLVFESFRNPILGSFLRFGLTYMYLFHA